MFYYYEKAGKLLASERRDLPYLKAEPAPGTPICYLVEGDPVLGRGSFKVNCPGQLRAPHGLEVLDASRLPDFPLDAPLSAALEEGLLTAVNTSIPAGRGGSRCCPRGLGRRKSGSISWPSGTWAPPCSPG